MRAVRINQMLEKFMYKTWNALYNLPINIQIKYSRSVVANFNNLTKIYYIITDRFHYKYK